MSEDIFISRASSKKFIEKVSSLVTEKFKVADPDEMRKSVRKFRIDTVCESIYDEFVNMVDKMP